jgi:hypothetical protein
MDQTSQDLARTTHDEYRTTHASETLMQWLRCVAVRDDGLRILGAVLPRLAARAHRDRRGRRDWSAAGAAVDACAKVIASLDETVVRRVVDEMLVMCAEHDGPPSIDRIVAVALVFDNWVGPRGGGQQGEVVAPARDVADRIWATLNPLFLSSNERLAGELARDGEHVPSWTTNVLGFLLAHTSNPRAAWWQAYAALEARRRRWIFGRNRYNDGAFSGFLVVVGFASILWLRNEGTATPVDAKGYYSTIFSHGLRLHLTRPGNDGGESTALAWSLQLVRPLFEAEHLDELERLMRTIGRTDDTIATGAFCIWKSGVELLAVEGIVRRCGADLREIAARVTMPKELPAGAVISVPPHFAELRRELEALANLAPDVAASNEAPIASHEVF